jgi:hypothetical protein
VTAAATPTYGLHVDLGEHTSPWAPQYRRWLRYPTADYRCPCGYADSASGDQVPAFAATARRIHQAACPLTQPAPGGNRPAA